jgi:hypothetical protein
MANIRYLRCSKCGCDATPRKWNPAKPEIEAEVGTSTMMRCGDCNTDGSPYACMCRDCCPTGHGTNWVKSNDEVRG